MSESKAGVEAIRIQMIRLYEPWTECRLCGADTPSRWGVPMYEGNLLSNNFKGEWFAAPACLPCHDLHAMGELHTFDSLYAYAARPLFEELLLTETSRVLRLMSMKGTKPSTAAGGRVQTGDVCEHCDEPKSRCQCPDGTCEACGAEYPFNGRCVVCNYSLCGLCPDCCATCPECGCEPCACL